MGGSALGILEPRGWLTPAEAAQLAKLADGLTVLEIGTYCGLSTLHMAKTAKRINTVDWHHGDRNIGRTNTAAEFLANLQRSGHEDKVIAHIGKFKDVLPLFKDGSFDMVFIDGAHDEANVAHDTMHAARLATKLIVWHDWGYASVQTPAKRIAGNGPYHLVDTLAWTHRQPKETDRCSETR